MEKITFVTTIKNDVDGTRMLFDSLLKQSKLPDEVVVTDAMSDSATEKTLKMYESDFKKIGIPFYIIRQESNRANGRNIAIEKSSHKIIAVSDAGCILSQHWLSEISRHFDDKDIDVVAGYYQPSDGNSFQKCVAAYTCVMPDKMTTSYLPSSRSIAFKKASWKKVEGYPEKLDYCEDLVFARNMKKAGLHFIIDTKATVTWPQVTSWKAIAKQLFMYARGDGQALYVRPQTPLLFGRYMIGVSMLLLGFIIPNMWYVVAVAMIMYLLWAMQKNYKYVQHPLALVYLPALQILADAAVMIGMLIGIADRAPIAKATLWQIMGKLGASLFGLLSFALLARTLSPTLMGSYAYIISLSVMLLTIADFGIDTIIMRESAKKDVARISQYLSLRALLSVVVVGLGISLGVPFLIAGIGQAFFLLTNGLLAYQKGKKEFFAATLFQLYIAFIMFCSIGLGILISAPVEGYIALGALGSIIAFIFVTHHIDIKLQLFSLRTIKKTFIELLPFGCASLISVAYFKLDVLFLGHYYSPSSFPDVGLYAIAYRPFELAIVIGGLYTQTLLPFITVKLRDKIFLLHALFKTCVLATIIGITLYVTAPLLIHLIGGEKYVHSIQALRILALAATATIIAGYSYAVVIAYKQEKLVLYSSIVTLLVNICLNVLLIPPYSYIGASWATLGTQIALCVTASAGALYVMKFKKASHR